MSDATGEPINDEGEVGTYDDAAVDSAIVAGGSLLQIYGKFSSTAVDVESARERCEFLEALGTEEQIALGLAYLNKWNSDDLQAARSKKDERILRAAALHIFHNLMMQSAQRSFTITTAAESGGRERFCNAETGKWEERRMSPKKFLEFSLADDLAMDLTKAAHSVRALMNKSRGFLTAKGREKRSRHEEYKSHLRADQKDKMRTVVRKDIAKWIQYTPANVMSSKDGLYVVVPDQSGRPEPARIRSAYESRGIPPYLDLDDKFYSIVGTNAELTKAFDKAREENLRLVTRRAEATISVRPTATYDIDDVTAQYQLISLPAVVLTLLQRSVAAGSAPLAQVGLHAAFTHMPNLVDPAIKTLGQNGEDVLKLLLQYAEGNGLTDKILQSGEIYDRVHGISNPGETPGTVLNERSEGSEEALKKAMREAVEQAKLIQAELNAHPGEIIPTGGDLAEMMPLNFIVGITVGGMSLDEATGAAADFTASIVKTLDKSMKIRPSSAEVRNYIEVGNLQPNIKFMIDSIYSRVLGEIKKYGAKEAMKHVFGKK